MPVVRPPVPQPLELLPAPSLPSLSIEADWKRQPRLWGHAFHPMCTYLGSFPASLAHAFISRWSRPGDVVLDPFSGRGTVPLQACVERRIGVGIDRNPLAHLLTAAKVDPPTEVDVERRLGSLQLAWASDAEGWTRLARSLQGAADGALIPADHGSGARLEVLPAHVASAFDERTLGQLLALRRWLDHDDRTDRFLAGAVTGILHGRSAGYLSTALPNTFSLGPGYTARYLRDTRHAPPERDVFVALRAKVRRLYGDGRPAIRGVAVSGDAVQALPSVRAALRSRSLPDRARLVITSPPYLRVVRYGAYNWLRLWFLGHDPAAVDAALTAAPRVEAYAAFLRSLLTSLGDVLTDDAVVVLVVGDVARDRGRRVPLGPPLAQTVWELAAAPAGYRLAGSLADPVAAGRKLTRMWGPEAGRATDVDRLLVLAPTELGRRRALAGLGTPVDWSRPPRRGARGRPTILAPYAADVPPGRPRGHGPAGPHEEPGSRPHDEPPAELHPAAAGASVRP